MALVLVVRSLPTHQVSSSSYFRMKSLFQLNHTYPSPLISGCQGQGYLFVILGFNTSIDPTTAYVPLSLVINMLSNTFKIHLVSSKSFVSVSANLAYLIGHQPNPESQWTCMPFSNSLIWKASTWIRLYEARLSNRFKGTTTSEVFPQLFYIEQVSSFSIYNSKPHPNRNVFVFTSQYLSEFTTILHARNILAFTLQSSKVRYTLHIFLYSIFCIQYVSSTY